MTSALRLSTQTSFETAWQLGQLRFLQELLWISRCPQSVHWFTLHPRFPVLQFKIARDVLSCTVERSGYLLQNAS